MTLNQAATEEEIAQIRRLRLASLAEAATLLLLVLVAVPAKHLLGYPVATRIMGPVHGVAFITYVWILFATVSGGGWRAGEVARLLLAAFVPFGALANVGLLRRKQAALTAGS